MDSRAIVNVIDSLDSTDTTAALSANQGRILKEMIDDKNIITIKNGSTFNVSTSNVYTIIPMVLSNSVGSKLTLNNNGVLIGDGVSKVLVSSNMKIVVNTVGNKHSRICKNDTTMCWTNTRGVNTDDEITISNAPVLINVTSGDLITLRYYASSGDTISGGDYTPTYLTVEVIE